MGDPFPLVGDPFPLVGDDGLGLVGEVGLVTGIVWLRFGGSGGYPGGYSGRIRWLRCGGPAGSYPG